MSSPKVDFGYGHFGRYLGWHPDRELNPQYAHLPDVDRCGMIIEHPNLKVPGETCVSAVTFSGPVQREVFPRDHIWEVVCEEPLTLSPSLLCTACGDHGFIRDGKWVPA